MKASLVLKMGQNLTMTPQLQQAIRLLQMSTLDLQEEIQDALDSNPMLEREEEGETDSHVTDTSDDSHEYNANTQQNTSQEPSNSAENLADANEWNEQIPSELEIDTSWKIFIKQVPATCRAPTLTTGISLARHPLLLIYSLTFYGN